MTDEEFTSEADVTYGKRVGTRLRAIRRQKRMSLQDVEAESSQEFKASVLGAYERGERAISVPRLHRLARFYNVPVSQLLPRLDDEALDGGETHEQDQITIDLTRLEHITGPEASMLSRFLGMIQMQRQDFNGRMLTVRREDLRTIACILDTSVDLTSGRLEDLGLVLSR